MAIQTLATNKIVPSPQAQLRAHAYASAAGQTIR